MKSSEISNLEKHRGRNFCIGLIAALSFVLSAMNYTTYEDPAYDMFEEPPIVEEIFEVIRTPKEKKKLLPPPPKMTVADKIDIEEEIEFIEEEKPKLEDVLLDENIEEKKVVEYVPKPSPKPQPKPVPVVLPPVEEEIEEIISIAEHMPRFPGCEDKETLKKEKELCAQKSLLEFIYSKIKYPKVARENGIQGMVVAQFIVDKDGSIQDLKIVKDIGGGCGKETIRVLKTMPKWIPGIQGNRKVKVRYNIPIKYSLK